MDLNPVEFTIPELDTPLLKASAQFNEKADVDGGDFAETLIKAMGNLKELHNEASTAMQEYAAGGDINISEVMLSMEKSTMATQLALQIRNRLVESYQEITRMQI